MRFPKKMEKTERFFRFLSHFPENMVIQFPSSTSQFNKLWNCGKLRISSHFSTYKQDSYSFLGSNSYSARTLQSELVFSLSTASKSLLELEQDLNRSHTSPEQDHFENHRTRTSPIQDPNKSCLKCSKTQIQTIPSPFFSSLEGHRLTIGES